MGTRPAGPLVEERKHKLDGRTLIYPCVGLELGPGRAVLCYRIDRDTEVADGALHLPAGTCTYAVFWTDRPYNVYHWCDARGETIAYYCNAATETEVAPEAVEWLDLEADVLITPDRCPRVLDLEEVPAHLAPAHHAALGLALSRLARDGVAIAHEADALTAPHRAQGGRGR